MAHFAKLKGNRVVQVIVVPDKHENNATEYLHSLGIYGNWIQTSYNSNIRGKFAAIGDIYNPELDIFESPAIEQPEEPTP